MSHNLTETATFDAAVTVPDDGDARTAASVDGAFQSLANRTKFLKDALAAGLPNLRVVADITALKALTSMADGEVRIVENRVGMWVYKAASGATEALPYIVQPTSGGGRWYQESIGNLINPTGGALGTTVQWAIPSPNAVISQKSQAWTGSTLNVTVGAGLDVIKNAPFALSCQQGDVVDVMITGSYQCGNSAGALLSAVAAIYDGTTFTNSMDLGSKAITGHQSAAISPTPFCVRSIFICGSTGPFTAQLTAVAEVADGLVFSPIQFVTVKIRP